MSRLSLIFSFWCSVRRRRFLAGGVTATYVSYGQEISGDAAPFTPTPLTHSLNAILVHSTTLTSSLKESFLRTGKAAFFRPLWGDPPLPMLVACCSTCLALERARISSIDLAAGDFSGVDGRGGLRGDCNRFRKLPRTPFCGDGLGRTTVLSSTWLCNSENCDTLVVGMLSSIDSTSLLVSNPGSRSCSGDFVPLR